MRVVGATAKKAFPSARKGEKSDPFLPGFLSRLPAAPKSVALVCAARIGDFICATPAFRAFREYLPSSRLTLIGMPFHKELVDRNEHLDGFVSFPGFPGMAEQLFNARTALQFFQKTQKRRFDLAVQLHGSGVYSNPFTLLMGAKYTAGFVREGDPGGCLDAAMIWPASLPAARRALAMARFLGVPESGLETHFGLRKCDHDAADKVLSGCRQPFIGIHHGSREREKVWPEDCFAAAGRLLNAALQGTVLVVGGPDEETAGRRIVTKIGSHAKNLAGRQSLPEMGAVISRLSVFITNDSGPAHIAYALGTPSLTLFGTTDPAEWGPPPALRHRVLQAPEGKLPLLSAKEVIGTALALWETGK